MRNPEITDRASLEAALDKLFTDMAGLVQDQQHIIHYLRRQNQLAEAFLASSSAFRSSPKQATAPESMITADPELNLAARVFMEENPNVDSVSMTFTFEPKGETEGYNVEASFETYFVGLDTSIDAVSKQALKDAAITAYGREPFAFSGSSLLITRESQPGVIHLIFVEKTSPCANACPGCDCDPADNEPPEF